MVAIPLDIMLLRTKKKRICKVSKMQILADETLSLFPDEELPGCDLH